MSPAHLNDILQKHIALSDKINLDTNGHGFAKPGVIDTDEEKNSLYEGYFMRSFISFERTLEEVFLHFACGGQSIAGNKADCRLVKCDSAKVRGILKQGSKFIDWANMDQVRDRAVLFFVDGKPFIDLLISKSDELAEIQKIRNRISHDSLEARASYDKVLIHLLGTKPIFEMSPGQLLRTKRKKAPALSLQSHYLAAMTDVLSAICEKP